jgi:hypothetical protein
MEVTHSSDTSVYIQTTRLFIQQDGGIQDGFFIAYLEFVSQNSPSYGKSMQIVH